MIATMPIPEKHVFHIWREDMISPYHRFESDFYEKALMMLMFHIHGQRSCRPPALAPALRPSTNPKYVGWTELPRMTGRFGLYYHYTINGNLLGRIFPTRC